VSTAVDLDRFTFNSKVPPKIRGLYSGTYNNYYDLEKSHEYIIALQNLVDIEVHWARPHESHRKILNAGETQIYEVTQNEMASVIPQFSFGISICKQNAGPSLMAAMPTKVAEFLASGRPVVVSKGIGDLDQFFSEFRAGIIVDTDADDFSEKAKELLALLSDPDTPTQCRSLAEKYFDFDEGVKSYLDLYRRILKN
jgi:glycosyltransferase involved in cell wall biosynthesis